MRRDLRIKYESGTAEGFTILELLVVALIVGISFASVGVGFTRLSSIDEINREKARVLESLCVRATVMQPRVAIGAAAIQSATAEVTLRYPNIIFGVAFETNQFLQVTNYVISVKDGVLEGQVCSAKEANSRQAKTSYGWLDELFVRQSRQSMMLSNDVVNIANGVLMRYAADVPVGEGVEAVSLAVPVRLRNQEY